MQPPMKKTNVTDRSSSSPSSIFPSAPAKQQQKNVPLGVARLVCGWQERVDKGQSILALEGFHA